MSGDSRTGTLVLLLHGLGTTGAVWSEVRRRLAAHDRTILAPDLPGHGSSRPAPPYTLECLARGAIRDIPQHRRLVVVGHSLGGYVALALAGGAYGVHPVAALSIGAKLMFSDADRARGTELAAKPVRWFATHAEAEERYRLVCGLPETLFPDAECIERGVCEGEHGFRLATDPAALAIQVPGFASLLAEARCPVRIARGEHDALVSREECAALGRNVSELPGLGHNAHVENPELVADVIEELL